jgi:speckle-type POZ protein
MLTDGIFSDVTFILEGDTRIKAHKAILASRCETFKMMLSSHMKEGTSDEIEIKDTNCQVFRNIINYIYTDDVKFEDIAMVVNLLIESNKYNLTRLKSICEWELTKIIDQENVVDLLLLSDIHEATELRNVCLEYAVEHFESVTKRKDYDVFKKLSKNTIVELLKRK